MQGYQKARRKKEEAEKKLFCAAIILSGMVGRSLDDDWEEGQPEKTALDYADRLFAEAERRYDTAYQDPVS